MTRYHTAGPIWTCYLGVCRYKRIAWSPEGSCNLRPDSRRTLDNQLRNQNDVQAHRRRTLCAYPPRRTQLLSPSLVLRTTLPRRQHSISRGAAADQPAFERPRIGVWAAQLRRNCQKLHMWQRSIRCLSLLVLPYEHGCAAAQRNRKGSHGINT